jgi:thioester reductase-like protein
MTDSTQVTFLTGFPDSVLARSVLRLLLEQDANQRVLCLVEANQHERAQREIALLGSSAERVSLLLGEAFAMDFGLSGKQYLELAKQVTVIHHCAATTFLGASRSEAKLGNLSTTREVLELAEVSSRLERLVHWSSALVSGKRRGVVREDELEASAGFRNQIEETRFRAEKMVRQAAQTLPVTIFRPSILAGDSTTGELDPFQGLFLLVRLMLNAPAELRIPLPALGEVRLNLVPVDYVAHAGCYIAMQPQSVGMTYHLVDPDPVSARSVFEQLSQATGHMLIQDSFAGDVLSMVLQFPGMQRIAPVPRAFLQQALTDVSYDSRQAQALLGPSGIECPRFDSYVQTLVQFVREHAQPPKPRGSRLRASAKPDQSRQWSFR